jgi:hypothetical protein
MTNAKTFFSHGALALAVAAGAAACHESGAAGDDVAAASPAIVQNDPPAPADRDVVISFTVENPGGGLGEFHVRQAVRVRLSEAVASDLVFHLLSCTAASPADPSKKLNVFLNAGTSDGKFRAFLAGADADAGTTYGRTLIREAALADFNANLAVSDGAGFRGSVGVQSLAQWNEDFSTGGVMPPVAELVLDTIDDFPEARPFVADHVTCFLKEDGS